MKKKKILFHIIASNKVGFGHAYRSFNIASLLNKKYKIFFLVKKNHLKHIKYFNKRSYKIFSYKNIKNIYDIINKNFDVIVNDKLDNSINYMKLLKKFNAKIINIEDYGNGLNLSDIKINELGDLKENTNKTTFYGYKYFLLRTEFLLQKKYLFRKKIKNILLTFGGTDPSNYTFKILKEISNIINTNIKIIIVAGPGYLKKKSLINYINKNNLMNIEFYDSTGLIAKLMSSTDLAICSNGRTLIELAYMRVPSIAISQNEREKTHNFWKYSNGSIYFDQMKNNNDLNKFRIIFKKLFKNNDYRKQLFDNLKKIKINSNYKIIEKIFTNV